MRLEDTGIDGLKIAHTSVFEDARGGFSRLYCQKELNAVLGNRQILQINRSKTTQAGALRGMHFQYAPSAEMKMVRCLKGKVFDVAIDLRPQSQTFLNWNAIVLSEESALMYVIPEGFAHGFQTLSDECELLYLHTAFYAPENEGGIRYNDPAIAIDWPMTATSISERDASHPLITKEFKGIVL